MKKRIVREVTPITHEDFFIVLNHHMAKFDFPIHYHPEYELNLVMNTEGKRIIGDSIKEYKSCDMVLIGPNTPHAWTGEEGKAHVITLQFHPNFLSDYSLGRKVMTPVKEMLDRSRLGISFSPEVTASMIERIKHLTTSRGFDSLLEFLSILYDLSISRHQETLSSASYIGSIAPFKSKRIDIINAFLLNNISRTIKISEVAEIVNMSPSAFSHFFKKRTQRSFSDYLLDLRIGHAAKMLIETDNNISEICFECGFNNLSNFNRAFKHQKGCTPREFRAQEKLIIKH
jgi:AraC-like DNA-binding protein